MQVRAGVKRCYRIVGDALEPVIDALRRNGKTLAATTEARSNAELKTDAEAELEWDLGVPRNEIGVTVIKEKIQQALVRSAEREADRIIVQVDGSKVTLRGAVRSYVEKQDAERAARAAPGVISVDNRIGLSPF